MQYKGITHQSETIERENVEQLGRKLYDLMDQPEYDVIQFTRVSVPARSIADVPDESEYRTFFLIHRDHETRQMEVVDSCWQPGRTAALEYFFFGQEFVEADDYYLISSDDVQRKEKVNHITRTV